MIHRFILSQCVNRKQKLARGQKASNINCSTVVFIFDFCLLSLAVSFPVVKFVFTHNLYEVSNILRKQSNLLWEKCLIKVYGANEIYIPICFDFIFLYLVIYQHALRLRHRVNVTLPQS